MDVFRVLDCLSNKTNNLQIRLFGLSETVTGIFHYFPTFYRILRLIDNDNNESCSSEENTQTTESIDDKYTLLVRKQMLL